MGAADNARDAPAEELDDFEAYYRAVDAHSILSHRRNASGVRDALLALQGWTLAEIAAGHRGACHLCLDRPPVGRRCANCGATGAA